MKPPWTATLLKKNVLSPLDVHFAGLMTHLSGTGNEALFLAAALASHYQGLGHVCFDLSGLAGKTLLEGEPDSPVCPPLERWSQGIGKEEVVGRPGEYKPLILHGPRLYLYRYWEYEKKLIDFLKERTAEAALPADESSLRAGLTRLFPSSDPGETDWQKVAALASVSKRFCVISGGPGTGKTFTVAKILTLFLEQKNPGPLRMALAAPTGKAAVRLQEALIKARERMDCPDAVKAALPLEAFTLHRLLKPIPESPYFRHDSKNPLPFEVVVIDEASMVDLALLSKLVQALPPQSKLILLGDKDQLASVEAGAVLGDICGFDKNHWFSRDFRGAYQRITGERLEVGAEEDSGTGMGDTIIPLKKSYRFGSSSGIGSVSRAVNEGDGAGAFELLRDTSAGDIGWRDLPRPEALGAAMIDLAVSGFSGYFQPIRAGKIFDWFGRFRILCALREGPYGVQALNRLVEQLLRQEGLIRQAGRWYPGRPVMITKNDYPLRLFNGDMGIALPDPDGSQELRVFFPSPDGGVRKFPPLRLPEHETGYALTVHKGQGSEFDRVLLILPDRDAPLLSRELIYTGITRAREQVEIWGKEITFRRAVSRRIQRSSGLREALWGADGIDG
jgi:exodeoxyribonuclease V alpha subunit